MTHTKRYFGHSFVIFITFPRRIRHSALTLTTTASFCILSNMLLIILFPSRPFNSIILSPEILFSMITRLLLIRHPFMEVVLHVKSNQLVAFVLDPVHRSRALKSLDLIKMFYSLLQENKTRKKTCYIHRKATIKPCPVDGKAEIQPVFETRRF
jgi:hypothetical protein